MANKRSGGGLSATQQAAKFLGVSVLAGAVAAGIALPAVGIAGLTAKETAQGFEELPIDLKRPPLSQKTRILDAEGGLIADVYSRNRVVVPLDDISPWMRKGIVAIEDSRFYEHGAVDLKGLLRALTRNAQSGEVTQGGSTLTQQYVKNVFVEEAGNEEEAFEYATRKTLGRKITELKYAIALEQELTKDQILENYLNITYFSEQAYGVEAAAQRYFSKPAKDLELHEAALLAGIVQNPSKYNPVGFPGNAKERRDTVLRRMAEVGDITPEEFEAAQAKELGLDVSAPRQGCITAADEAGFFCDYVAKAFLRNPAFGKTDKERLARWNRGGLTIRTTLQPKAQAAAAAASKSKVNPDDEVAAAVVSIEPGTGKIVAMAQSRPYGFNAEKHQTMLNLSVNHDMGGSTFGFQVGSTFKPVVAAAALEKGISPAHTFKSDYKHEFDLSKFTTCDGQPYNQEKYDVPNELKTERGTWDMTSALGMSINTYAIDLLQKTGMCQTAKMAKAMGITQGSGKPLDIQPSMALGAQPSSPLTMAAAYATFANRGTYCEPMAIESVTDAEGNELRPPGPNCSSAMAPKTADTINQMLKGVVEDGTGTSAGLPGRETAGKTGTTDERRNAWFVGYTPELSTAVWVGGDGAEKVSMFDITIGGQYYAKVSGGGLPGPIWRTAMSGALEGVPASAFNPVKVPRAKPDKDKKPKDDDRDDGRPGGPPPPGDPEWPEFPWDPLTGGNGNGGGNGSGGWTDGGTTDGGTTDGGTTGGTTDGGWGGTTGEPGYPPSPR
ncbi:transglycosylase domain-containing protein [Streptomyces sp. WMMC1477]|uniref:transglycosylase domain-containing protein n=1 Tax=Streptomyces sp. WMMC1477 TaxID=3015155 RepID=UPI0022B654E2|nr:transglycosylase domain-containing protein [Streptomyces sp. WMMC1477]MCZ7432147.1 transglycosylase domain-containing protein [Streptomyces sp. WMMC1477]